MEALQDARFQVELIGEGQRIIGQAPEGRGGRVWVQRCTFLLIQTTSRHLATYQRPLVSKP